MVVARLPIFVLRANCGSNALVSFQLVSSTHIVRGTSASTRMFNKHNCAYHCRVMICTYHRRSLHALTSFRARSLRMLLRSLKLEAWSFMDLKSTIAAAKARRFSVPETKLKLSFVVQSSNASRLILGILLRSAKR